MFKKGFTLIELLAVIIVLTLIMIISIPAIANLIGAVKQDVYLKQERFLVNAAKLYLSTNEVNEPQNIGDYAVISLSDLHSRDFISTVKNPNNDANNCDGYVVVRKMVNNNMVYYPYIDCGDSYQSPGYTANTYPSGSIKLHLDSSVVKANNGDKLAKWTDLSGWNHEAVQTNVSKQPIMQNGVFHFDGTDDALIVNNTNGNFNLNSTVTWAVMYRIDVNHEQYDSIMGYGSNNWDIRMDGPTYFRLHSYNVEGEWPPCTDIPKPASVTSLLDGWISIIYVWDASTGIKRGYINGELAISGAMRSNTTARDLTNINFSVGAVNNGSGRNFNGDIAEIIIYDRVLAPEEVTELNTYLQDKWANIE